MESNKIKMNIDGSIRAKVLQYKSDGNTLTEKWETLTKHAEGIYYSYTDADKYGQRSVNIIFAKNGVYWRRGSETEHLFNPESFNYAEHMESLKRMYADYEADILQAAANGGWLNKLHIAVMERLGHDVAPLLAAYEERKRKWQENERKRIDAAEKAEREREEAEQRRVAELLADGKEKLMAHKAVTVEQIELLAEAVDYKIHIRTLGFMRKKVSEAILKEDETVTVWGRKLTSRNISGTADVLREIAARVKAQAEEAVQQPATATETPQISTETAETVKCTTEDETEQETANLRTWRFSKPDYAKIIVGDYSQGKVVAILSHISGKSYIEISNDVANIHTVGTKELSIAKPITELTEAEVYDIIYSWSPKPPTNATQSTQTPQTANYAAPTPKRQQRPRKQPHQQFKQCPQPCTK